MASESLDFVRHSPKGYSFGMQGGLYFVDLEESAKTEVLSQLWLKLAILVTSGSTDHEAIRKCQRLLRIIDQANSGRLKGYYEDVLLLVESCRFLEDLKGWQYIKGLKKENGIYERAVDIALSMGEILAE